MLFNEIKKNIWEINYLFNIKYFSFINHVLEKKIIANHHRSVIQFNKIHKNIIQINVHFRKKCI
jgi:hypothetical protein